MGNQITNTRYGTMLYPAQDTVIGRSLDLYGEWYQSEMDCMQPYLPKGGIAIDVGANIGCHTLFFAEAVGAGGQVIAFEPQRILFQMGCANASLNHYRNILAIQAAVGKEPGTVFLPAIDYDQPGNFGMVGRSSEGVSIDVVCLDQYLFPRVDLIKIDVEGMEPEVLLGAAKTLQTHRPVLYIEYHPETHSQDLLSILTSYGYRIQEHFAAGYNPQNYKREPRNIHGNFHERNLLCLPSNCFSSEIAIQ